MCISSFVLALRQLIEHPLGYRSLSASHRAYLLQLLQGVSTRGAALAFLRQHFVRIMSLPWQRTDILSELCRTFSPSELEEASIFLHPDRVPSGFQGTGYLVNRASFRQVANHPSGARLHYFGNWLVHASTGVVEAYDNTHVINEGHCEVQMHDVAYMTQPDRVYYSVVSVLQGDLADYDQLRRAGMGNRIIQQLTDSLPAGRINLSETYLRPQQFSGDVLIDENDQWAVVYNHYMGGAYTVLSKVKESVISANLSLNLIPRRLSPDVRQLLRAIVADTFIEYAGGNGRLPLLMEEQRLQVVYNRERDGFVVYGAFADRPYDSVPFFWEYDYRKPLVENLTEMQQALVGCVGQTVDFGS